MKAIEASQNLYNIPHWSQGYFDIDAKGQLHAFPEGLPGKSIAFKTIIEKYKDKGYSLPVLVRFMDILKHRHQCLYEAFAEEIEQQNYENIYTCVYPIKVNQQHQVVDALVNSPSPIGLEAGSKAELLAIMGMAPKKDFTIICNGYKDSQYIELALIAQQMGLKVFIILEKFSELGQVLTLSKTMQVKPLLGLRIRLSSIAKGNWQNTGGEKSKFGLTAQQILKIIDILKAENLTSCLKLLHTHMGSQISNIRDIQNGLRECANYYLQMVQAGIPLEIIDIGGGLGIDYEGSRSRNFCSINYSLKEYAHQVIKTLKEICHKNHVKAPAIITEAGRAMSAHHAVLLLPIINIEASEKTTLLPPVKDAHTLLQDLWRCFNALNDRSVFEIYHEICHLLTEAQTLFNHGLLNLQDRAYAEALFKNTCLEIISNLNPASKAHLKLLEELQEKHAEKIFLNFSLFQSLPDVWAINQIFPILPIEHLDKPIHHRATLKDITCDSDGRIDLYIDGESLEKTLPLPALKAGDTLAVFLVGAYQETLGDMHNLFGDTHVVNVEKNTANEFEITCVEPGDTVAQLLEYVHFNPEHLLKRCEHHLAATDLNEETKIVYLEKIKQGFDGYSYLGET